MSEIIRLNLRKTTNPVIIGFGNREEIIQQVQKEMAATPCEDTQNTPNSIIMNFKDEFDIFHVAFLDEVPEYEEDRIIKLASWSSAIVSTLTAKAIEGFSDDKKAKFMEYAVKDLLSEIFALQKRKEKEKSEWLRSISKMVVPLKRALDKCTTEDSKAKIQQAINDAEATENKAKAKEIINAIKNDDSLKQFFTEESDRI